MCQLAAKVLSAKLGVVYSAENDPNKVLGHPNGYASKVSFTDSRVEQNKAAVGPRSQLARQLCQP
jgi:hypothetical protein